MNSFFRFCVFGFCMFRVLSIISQITTADVGTLKQISPWREPTRDKLCHTHHCKPKAYPNPELEIGGASSTGIGPGALNGCRRGIPARGERGIVDNQRTYRSVRNDYLISHFDRHNA